ncbi:MAG TPA: DOMON-like domain-containing protein [Steroidobacteraceae bacterium]|nr:DOMON-like domain-containing protein [Steroidobacteraceae bacterium]
MPESLGHTAPLLDLLAHPATPGVAVRRISALAERIGAETLRFKYLLQSDPKAVRIPPAVAGAGKADRLWAHTCFEAFVRQDESPGYMELNFSPSGQWAAYGFESYRQGMAPARLSTAPRVELRQRDCGLELEAVVALSGWLLPGSRAGARPDARRLRLGLSTVVEDQDGGLSYWALRHPPGRPDFHHPESFPLTLELPGPA